MGALDDLVKGIQEAQREFLIKIYHEIDFECNTNTDMVKMKDIKGIFVKYGCKKEDFS